MKKKKRKRRKRIMKFKFPFVLPLLVDTNINPSYITIGKSRLTFTDKRYFRNFFLFKL